MKVIFLDVDGVLNYRGAESKLPQGSYFVENDKLALLKKLVDTTGASIVLSSSWRRGWSSQMGSNPRNLYDVDSSKDYFMLCARLNDYGLNFLSEIPRMPNGSREDAIGYWLSQWPGERITDYVILDDESNKFSPGNPHLVLTSIESGLQPEQIRQAQLLLSVDGEMEKPHILLVDDMEINREVLKEILQEEFQIVQAEDGASALAMLETDKYIELVITDIQMPGMNGIELIRNIRANPKFNGVAIIANTQYGDPQQEEQLLELGANDFVYKPTTPKIIKMRVKNAMLLKRG